MATADLDLFGFVERYGLECHLRELQALRDLLKRVDRAAPDKRGQHVSAALIPWTVIEAIREEITR